ncbi:hypothetical protein GCM10009734_90790 [Nonomuraea bangladeshensis]
MFSKADIRICRGFGVKPSCGQQVRMTRTEAGAPFPVNLAPDPKGNVAVWRDVTGVLRSRRVTQERPLAAHEKLMMPHVATCKPPTRTRTTTPPRPPRARPAAAESFYQVLGVERSAGPDDIKRAYRRLARQLHPDVNPGDEAAAERFKRVTQAYDVLSDPRKRQTYDLTGRAPRPGR